MSEMGQSIDEIHWFSLPFKVGDLLTSCDVINKVIKLISIPNSILGQDLSNNAEHVCFLERWSNVNQKCIFPTIPLMFWPKLLRAKVQSLGHNLISEELLLSTQVRICEEWIYKLWTTVLLMSPQSNIRPGQAVREKLESKHSSVDPVRRWE